MDSEGPAGRNGLPIAIWAGLVAPVVAVAAILLATLLDPSFSWTGSSLSHTGELPPGRSVSLGLLVDRPSFLLFNGGLIAAGLVGLPFAWLLYDVAGHPLERSGAVLLGLALGSLVAVGVFHLPWGLHAPVAVVHFIATMAFLWIYGVGAVQAGRPRFGAATAALGAVVVGTWFVWGQVFPGLGIALPEFLSALALAGWTFVAASRQLEAVETAALAAELGDGP